MKNRQLALALLFLTLSCRGISQTDTIYIPFVAYWSKGDSYDFAVRKIKKKWDNGSLTKNDTIGYIARFEVLDSTEPIWNRVTIFLLPCSTVFPNMNLLVPFTPPMNWENFGE
jgi:hypothetical protein